MEVLGALGFSPGEALVYRTLVGLGATDLVDLGRRCTMADSEVEHIVVELRQRGLVAESAVKPGRWVAAPPAVALRALVNDRRHELELAELAATRLAEAHRTEAAVDLHDLVEVVIGAGAVGQRFHQLQLGAVDSVCAFVSERPVAVTGADNVSEDVAVSRGVAYRIVVERDSLIGESVKTEVVGGLQRNQEVRVVEKVPTKLVIADGRTAMVPFDVEGTEPSALIIHASGLVSSLQALFESVWSDAWPLALTATSSEGVVERRTGPDEFDLKVLSLLLAGSSDARIARQLDVGLRTVQRRVRAMIELADVSMRIQLGWVAHERGWIERV